MLMQRRHFLKTTALGAAGLLLHGAGLAAATEASPIKVGIIGCGGRGMGAVADALEADPGVVIWAMADVFSSQISKALSLINSQYGEKRVMVPAERQFTGLDGYQKLLKSGVDVVLLCTPPVFRPEQIRASVDAGVHLFAEKPVAVDIPGCLSVLESAKIAKEKNLIAYDGFCWRFDSACRATMAALKEGKFGKAQTFNGLYYSSPPKTAMSDAARSADATDVEWALQNWTSWNWLSGGPIVEQMIHTIDLMCWSFDEALPIAAFGSGGRAQRQGVGDVWDHYEVFFELPNRVQTHVSSRQWVNCHPDISNRTTCEKGTLVTPYRPRFEGSERWRFSGEANNMYRQTHKELFADYRAGRPTQMLEASAHKTMIAILGRTAAHTGQRVTWEELLKDTTSLMPENLTWDTKLPAPVLPVPGKKQN